MIFLVGIVLAIRESRVKLFQVLRICFHKTECRFCLPRTKHFFTKVILKLNTVDGCAFTVALIHSVINDNSALASPKVIIY